MNNSKVNRKPSYQVYDPRPNNLRCTTSSEIDMLREKLLAQTEKIAILHVIPPSSTSTVTSNHRSVIPSSIRVRIMQQLHSLPHPLSLNDIQQPVTTSLWVLSVVHMILKHQQNYRVVQRGGLMKGSVESQHNIGCVVHMILKHQQDFRVVQRGGLMKGNVEITASNFG